MPGYIPKEQLDAYRRWQAESFDPPPPEPDESFLPLEPEVIVDESSELVTEFPLPTAEDIERIHNEAHQAGYEAGFAEGRDEGYRAGFESLDCQARQLAALADNLKAALGTMDQTVADQVLELSMEVANQVLRSTIAVQPEALLPIIKEGLAALPLHHGHVVLHVHPDEAEMVRSHVGENFSQAGWRIQEDKGIEAGGCFIQAGSSEVDATLGTRWKRVLEAIGADPSAWLQKP